MQQFIIHTDGGSRGNPGPAAVGVVIEKLGEDGKVSVVSEFGRVIGDTTNNVAEYTAVIDALTFFKKNGGVASGDTLHFYLDSVLVVNQILGKFKINQAHLKLLLLEIHALEQEVGGVMQYTSVPREENKRADFFVNQALDAAR
jgi:ribonuclease HI